MLNSLRIHQWIVNKNGLKMEEEMNRIKPILIKEKIEIRNKIYEKINNYASNKIINELDEFEIKLFKNALVFLEMKILQKM